MTTLTLRKRAGAYVLDGHPASLRTGVSMRRGEIRTAAGDYHVDVTDFHRIGGGHARRAAPGGPVAPARIPGARTRRNTSLVAGPLGRRSHARLEPDRRLPGRLARRTDPGRGHRSVDELDLVLLTTCFAVMTRRRKRTLTIMAIVAATGYH